MSDLFGRLAQRALASGAVLRPITPPIFGAPVGAPAGVAEPEAVTLSGPAGVAAMNAEPASGRALPGDLMPASEARSSPRTANPPPAPTQRPRRREEPGTVEAATAQPRQRPVRREVVESPDRRPIEPVSRLRPATRAATPAAAAEGAAGRTAAHPGAGADSGSTAHEPALTASRTVRNPAGAVRSRSAAEPRSERRRLTSEPAPAAPPTIRVTIGRVEVRAAAPAPQPSARPARPPKLSLEAYVASRQEGNG